MGEAMHTPEPWKIKDPSYGFTAIVADALLGARSSRVANFDTGRDALRAVACVNACAGMTNDELDFPTGFLKRTQQMAQDGSDEAEAEIEQLRNDRGDLYAALANVVTGMREGSGALLREARHAEGVVERVGARIIAEAKK